MNQLPIEWPTPSPSSNSPSPGRQIEAEGAAAYPNECCGILIGRDVTADGVTRRVVERSSPVDNAFEADEQYHRFSIDPRRS